MFSGTIVWIYVTYEAHPIARDVCFVVEMGILWVSIKPPGVREAKYLNIYLPRRAAQSSSLPD